MKNLYVRELNKEDFNKIKVALVVALKELDALDTLEDAFDSKLEDLNDLIDVDKVLSQDFRDLTIELYDLFCPYGLFEEYEIDFGIKNFENSLEENFDNYVYDLMQEWKIWSCGCKR